MASKQTNHITIDHTEIVLRSDGIVQINASDRTYNIEDIKAIHKSVNVMMNNEKALLLLIASQFTSIDVDVRNFLSTPEAGQHSIAEAYVIKSLAQRILINFIVKVKGTPVPVKFFTDVNLAVRWLNTYK